MNRFFKIITIILVLLANCAPSCVDEHEIALREDAVLEEARHNIRREFESEYLSGASLLAFENAAKQKLTDLSDYLNILADTSLDISFREKAGEMVQGIFISENVFISIQTEGNDGPMKTDVGHFVKLETSGKISTPPFSFDSIVTIVPLRKSKGESFTGKLSFIQYFFNSSQTKHNNKVKRQADFYLLKEIKIFDSDTLRAWNVLLGEIR